MREMDSYEDCMDFIVPALTLAEADDWDTFAELFDSSDVGVFSVLITLLGSWLQLADALSELSDWSVAEIIQEVALRAKEAS